MAIYGRWNRFLTGERLLVYKRNIKQDAVSAIIFVVLVTYMNNHSDYTKKLMFGWGFLILLIVIIAQYLHRFLKKETVYQLRRQELDEGQKQAQDILKGLKLKVNK